MTSAPASTLRSTGLVVLDGSDGLVTVLSGLLHRSGMRLEIGQTAADGVDLALRAGDPDAIPDLVVLSGPDATATERCRHRQREDAGAPHGELGQQAVSCRDLVRARSAQNSGQTLY